ncbi:hypothetical protein GQ600_17823 [Phytophthora cactorum]|nr:hypothetical protein GQ600_17823 [Phytophthora cactorum]
MPDSVPLLRPSALDWRVVPLCWLPSSTWRVVEHLSLLAHWTSKTRSHSSPSCGLTELLVRYHENLQRRDPHAANRATLRTLFAPR